MNSKELRQQKKNLRSRISSFLRLVLRITTFIVILFAVTILLLHVQPIQNIAGQWFLVSAGKILQKQITCDSFQISLFGKAEFHNMAILHHERFGNNPLASAKKLSITFSPLSFLTKQIHIKHILIDSPVFNLIWASDKNHNLQINPFEKNLKKNNIEAANAIHSFFKNFQPDAVQVTNGRFLLDHKPSEYRLFVPSLDIKGAFNKTNDCIHLLIEGFCVENTYPEKLNFISDIRLQADISEEGVQHSLITICSNSSQTWISGRCTLENFENPHLVFNGSLITDLDDVKSLTMLDTILKGDSVLFFSGHGSATDLDVSGKYSGNSLQFGQFKFANFDAQAFYRNQLITISDGKGNAYDGSFTGTAEINLDFYDKSLDIVAEGKNLNLAVLTQDIDLPFQLETSASVSLNIFGNNFNSEAIIVNGAIQGVEKKPFSEPGLLSWKPFDLSAKFTFIDEMFGIPEGQLSHPDHQIILNSCIFSADTLEGSIWGSTESLADFLQRANRAVTLQIDVPGLDGQSIFNVDLGGTTSDYLVAVDLNSDDIRFRSEQIGNIQASVLISPEFIDIESFSIAGSDLIASGQLTLGMPVTGQAESVSLRTAEVDVDLLDINLLDAIFLSQNSLSGKASGTLRVCDEDPCISSARIDVLELFDISIKPADIIGRITPSGIFDTVITAVSEDTELIAKLDYPFTGTPVVSIDARNVPFDYLPGLEFLGISGVFDLTAQTEPTSDDIKIRYQLTSSNPTIMNRITSRFDATGYYRHGDIPFLDWNANWNNDMAKSSGYCSLTFPYGCSLETQTNNFPLTIVSDVINKDSEAPNPFKGFVTLDASLSGNLSQTDTLKADIHLNKMEFDYLDILLVLDQQGELHLADNTLSIQPLVFTHPSIDMNLGGQIDMNGNLSLQTTGNLNLSFLDALTDFFEDTRGNCNFELALKGPWLDPNYFGNAYVQEFFSYLPLFGSSLEDYHAEIQFNQKLGKISYFEGLAGGSYFGGAGEIGISSYVPDLFDVRLSGDDMEFEYPKDFHSIGDVSLQISGHLPDITIGGMVNLRQSQYGARINYKTMIVNESRAKLTFAERRKPIRLLDEPSSVFNPKFNISVRANDNIHISNNIARVEMNMKLDVTGNLLRPKVLGHIDVLRGDVTFLQRNFELLSASIDFADPNKIDPLLILQASTTLDDYRVNLDISGNIYSDMNIRPSSTPPLNDIDLWNLLLIGKTREKMTSSEDYLAGGVAYVTGSLQEQIEQRFEYWIGFDEFSIDPIMSTSDESPSARFTAKKRFGPDLSVLYSRSATSTEDLILVEYQLSDNIYIIGHKKEDNSIGVDFRYRWEFE